jgi:hypothetical protein
MHKKSDQIFDNQYVAIILDFYKCVGVFGRGEVEQASCRSVAGGCQRF